jgi:hypothetical protein
MAEERNSISVVYEKNKDAKTVPANGAFGGPAPDNSGVIVHLYLEYGSVPHSTDFPIVDGQVKMGPPYEESITRGNFTREVQTSVFMSAESAIAIGKWLIQKGELVKNLKEGKNPLPPEEQ